MTKCKLVSDLVVQGVTLMGYDNGMESFLNTATLLNCRRRKPMNGLCQFHTPAERKYNKQTTPALNDLGNIIFCHSLSKIRVRIFLPRDLWKNRHWGGNKNIQIQLRQVTVSYQCRNKGFMGWRDILLFENIDKVILHIMGPSKGNISSV